MSLDAQLFYLLYSVAGQSPLTDAIIAFLAKDLAYIAVAAFLALLFLSTYPKRVKLEIFTVTFASALIARYGVTELIRFFYHHPRPPVLQLVSESSWSFPSGHATFFFAFATAIYFYNKKWGIGFFIAAAVVTVSRVMAGVHYPSDIIGGAIIGVLVAYATYFVVRRTMFIPTDISASPVRGQ